MLANHQNLCLILPPIVAPQTVDAGQFQQRGMTVVDLMTAVTILGVVITIYMVLTV